MADEKEGVNRRDFLTIITAAVGAAGVGAATVPFIKAMSPTKDIIAAGIMEVDISDLKAGELKTVLWRKQPVFILKRTPQMIEKANSIDPASLKDPAAPEERLKRPDILVCLGICTHLGCIPDFRSENVPDLDQPGWYCPCHGGKYDTLGRRLGGPPPENLHLVPYEFIDDTKIKIGTAAFAGFGENVRKIKDLPKT